VRETIEKRTASGCKATLVFDTGGPVGSDHLLIVKPVYSEEDWLVNRWFYFDEQTQAYMWNFAEKVCTDEKYRQQSLEETADWKRVANLYEPLARRLYQELSQSERSDFPILNDSSRPDSEKLESLCEELFKEIKAIVRQRKDRHLETVYEEKEAELQRWLAEKSA
jgi:formyltetrahydrofolate synthetase